ncbi:hypothetical protein K431DRAFT_52450 [Polychaeton citri CBS 116435]|uniref:Uncharacterized protein n=1 Tax=Polychaeton citri CBS 116435 TaxID=1314669 RepID=A0A9P4UT62_9PEZI|nr:hypothetical protein K431DRAFT_52450 [Polychaeton citri CBS 116435]
MLPRSLDATLYQSMKQSRRQQIPSQNFHEETIDLRIHPGIRIPQAMSYPEVTVIDHSDAGDNAVDWPRVQEHNHASQLPPDSALAGNAMHRHMAPASIIRDCLTTSSADGSCNTLNSSHGHFTPPPESLDQSHYNAVQFQHQLALPQAIHQANVCQVTLDSIIKQLVQELMQLKQAIPGLLQSNASLTCRLQQAETRLHALSTDEGWKRTEAAHIATLAEAKLAATALEHAKDLLQTKLDDTMGAVSEKEATLLAKDKLIKQLQVGELRVDPTTARLVALNEATQRARLANEQSATAENVELRAKLLSSDRARQRLRNENDLFRTQLTSLAANRQYPGKRKKTRRRILDCKAEDEVVKRPFFEAMETSVLPVKEEPCPDA